MKRSSRVFCLCAGVVALASLSFATASAVDPVEALERGNALVAAGELDEALEVYRRGWSPTSPHPTLVYNLATTFHHLDRLPEAVLWYRRGDGDDPWLQENLWLARRSLGSERLPPSGPLGWLARHRGGLAGVGILAAWAALAAFALPRAPRSIGVALALAAVTTYAASWGAERWGPRPGVLLEPCAVGGSALPAGTEAWVRAVDAGWTISGLDEVVCDPGAVSPIEP